MRKAIVMTVFITAITIGVWWLARLVQRVANLPLEAYASDWTGVFIIEHLRTTDTWPTGWHDLRDEYDRLAVPEFYAWSFEELQDLIDVNWNISIDEIKSSEIPFDLIRLTSGGTASYGGAPDVLVHDYIRNGTIPYEVPRDRIGG